MFICVRHFVCDCATCLMALLSFTPSSQNTTFPGTPCPLCTLCILTTLAPLLSPLRVARLILLDYRKVNRILSGIVIASFVTILSVGLTGVHFEYLTQEDLSEVFCCQPLVPTIPFHSHQPPCAHASH